MSEEKILTLHPEGKNGMNINAAKYAQVREAIVGALGESGPMIYSDFTATMKQRLVGFEGSIPWYVETVKLDLEARGIVSHDRKKRLISIV